MMNLYKQVFTKNAELDPGIYKELLAKELILRDYLAIERTILTNEATFLAYIRTSLTILVVGITIFHLSPQNQNLQFVGVVIAFIGVWVFIRGSIRSAKMKWKINKFLKKREQVETDINK